MREPFRSNELLPSISEKEAYKQIEKQIEIFGASEKETIASNLRALQPLN